MNHSPHNMHLSALSNIMQVKEIVPQKQIHNKAARKNKEKYLSYPDPAWGGGQSDQAHLNYK